MRNPLKFWLGTLAVFLLALTPSVVPVGGSVAPATASNPTCSPGQTSFTGNGTAGANGVAYTVVRFSAVGTCDWTVPVGVSSVDYLVVAGGGGGGSRHGGGGGAGGMVTGENLSVTAGSRHAITVGAGGLGSVQSTSGDPSAENLSKKGGNSAALGLSPAIGGGPGAVRGGPADRSGGSGGGSDASSSSAGSGTASQGNNGGQGLGSDSNLNWSGGGGGGAGAAGSNATSGGDGTTNTGRAGAGGAGRSSSITGTAVLYAGGGGGGTFTTAIQAGSGGTGGGGAGGRGVAGTNGTAGTGGGGGAGGHSNTVWALKGGDGGSGVVVIRYVTPAVPGTVQNFVAADRFVDQDLDTDSVSLSWTALTGQTPAVTQYEIEYSTSSNFSSPTTQNVVVTNSSAATPNSATIAGLVDGARYFFRIKARNAVGASASYATTASSAVSRDDYALDFNGTNMRASGSAVIPSTGGFTVEAWINPDSDPGDWQTILFQGTAQNDRFGIYYFNDTTLHVARDSNTQSIDVGNIVGDWSHVAVSVNQSTSSNNVVVYLNGAPLGTYSLGGGNGAGDPLYIGVDGGSGGPFPFDGEIDQVKVWSQVLTQAQVQGSMHSWDATGVSGSPTLLAHYDFNDNTQASVVRDTVGSQNLTVTNATTAAYLPLVDRPSRAGYEVYRFTRSYLTATGGWTVPADFLQANYLIVAGGGGGGGRLGGGGGAGGLREGTSNVTPGSVAPVVVGVGGAGGAGSGYRNPTVGGTSGAGWGTNGGSSSALNLTASGGGGGANSDTGAGLAGGSGGGGARYTGAGGAGTLDQGNQGGIAYLGGNIDRSGGGGGAGSPGASGQVSGNGGAGVTRSISGSSVAYAGGGGGSAYQYANGGSPETTGQAGVGGIGGGGAGSRTAEGANATPATGGGGGGGGYNEALAPHGRSGGRGGSGAVVLAFASSNTVTFKPNFDGGGSDTTQSITSDVATSLTANAFTRTGYTFVGWTTAADGSGSAYANGTSLTTTSNLTLYAQWTRIKTSNLIVNLDATNPQSLAANSKEWKSIPPGSSTSSQTGEGNVAYSDTAGIRSLTFDGSADYFDYTTVADSRINGAMTVEMWIKPGSLRADSWNILATRWFADTAGTSAPVRDWHFAIRPQGSSLRLNLYTTNTDDIFGSRVFTANSEWVLVGFTIDASGNQKFFVNGVQDGTTRTGVTRDPSGSVRFIIGDSRIPSGFIGSISKVRLYNTALTDAEMRSNFDAESDYFGYNEVTWDSNGGSSITSGSFAAGGTVAAPTPPNRSGYSFVGWSTTETSNNGDSGTAVTFPHTPGSAENITYFARWTADTYTVTFNKGSASGATGADQTSTKTHDVNLALPDSATANTYFTRSGFTVTGWSVNANGSTSDYALGANYTTEAIDTLYPVWTANTYLVTFNKGSVSGATGSDQSATKTGGVNLALPNSATANGYFTKTGYTVTGWSVNANGSTTDYALGASYTTEAIDTLYPVWTANVNTVTFKSNFVGGGSDTTQSITTDVATALTSNAFTRTGYTFAGWATSSGGSVVYANGASVTLTSGLTLHAQWSANTNTVTWDSNGGSSITSGSFLTGEAVNEPTAPTLTDKVFIGWSTSETANQGNSNARITSWPFSPPSPADLTLYAIWADELIAYEPFTGTSGQNLVGGSGTGSSGLTGLWELVRAQKQDSGLAISGVYSSAPNFALPRNTAFALPSSNTAASGADWRLRYSARALSAPVSFDSAGTYYFTYINHTPRVTYSGSSMVGLLSGLPASTSDTTPWSLLVGSPYWAKFGIDYGNANRASWVAGQTRGAVQAGTEVSALGTKVSSPTTESQAFFVLVKIVTAASGNDQISLRAFSPSETLPVDDSAITWDVTYAAPITGSGTHLAVETEFLGTIDEFRLGYTYESVTNVQNSYAVTYDTNGGSSVSAGSFFEAGSIASAPTAPTRTGYTFSGWASTSGGTAISFPYSPGVTNDITLYAVWAANSNTVTFKSNFVGGGSDTTQSITTDVATSLTSNAFTRTGYTFAGWATSSGGSVVHANGASLTLSAPLTLHAQWTANSYTITFNKGSVSGAVGSDRTATKTGGVNLALPDSATANGYFTKTGYTVTGWSVNADGSTTDYALGANYTTEAIDTLYPVWTANTYTVTYNYNSATGGNSVTSQAYTVDGIRVALPTPTRTGFTFDGWHSNVGLTALVGGAGASYAPTASITLYAKWTAATFTVLYEYNGASGGNSTDSATHTTGGTVITLPTPTRAGYTFGGWYSDVTLTSSVGAAGGSYSPTANLTIFAKWTAIVRTVTYNSTNTGGINASSGSVPTDGGSYIIGNTVVVKANSGTLTRLGYTFEGWVTNADGTGTALNAGETLTVAEANINLYPQWSANTYTITYNKNGGTGDLTAAPGTWQTGTSNVTLPNSGLTKTGFNFDGWQELGSTTKENLSYQPNYEDVTLVARWAIKNINYSFDKGTAGVQSITGWPTDSSANFASTITLPNLSGTTVTIGGSSYLFFGWQSGGTVYNSGDSYVMSETSPTFTAVWVQLFDVRYGFGGGTHSVAGNGASECDTGGLCVDGEPIVLRSSPERAGYTFSGWKVQDTSTVKAASAAHNVTATGYLFYAQWTAVNYRFTFNSLGGTLSPSREDRTIGQIVTLPSPGTRTGYSFGGWSADGGSTTYITGSSYVVGTEGQAFSAQWIPDVYAVTYDWQGGAGSTPRISDTYTVGTGDMTLPTASGAGYSRDGYNFSGWSTSIGGSLVSGFRPTADDVLYAIWADGNYTLSYDPKGGTVGSGLGTVSRGGSVTLPTPVRDNFTFVGWHSAATGGTKLGDGGASFTPSASSTLFARWVQDSLYGVDLATLETASTYTASNSSSTDVTLTHDPTGTSARVQIPSGALPNGTVVTVRYFKETDHQSGLIPGDNTYFFALLVSWLSGTGDAATVPDTAAGKPISVTLNNSNIKAGALVYQVIGERVTELGRATADGTVTVQLTQDPQLVVAATKPAAPSSVSGTSGDTRATISWTAGSSGGSAITGYTVTASPGGATCSTASTSCIVSSLSNNTAYTFRVVANNALGASPASSASSSVTPLGATYTVTFDANGGSAVSNGSFFSGSTVSAPGNPSRSGFVFGGWATTQDDATTKVTFPYAPGVTSAITLHALWSVAPVERGSSGGGNSGANNSSAGRAPVVPPGRTTVLPQPVSPLRPITAPIVIAPERGFDPDAGSKATVGGQSTAVTKTTPQDGGVSVGVGRVQVDISPSNQQGPPAPSAPGRATDLSVSTGQSATVSGGGLLPGSVLQVWLPGVTGGVAKELARIPVKNDGSFNSELTFTPQQTGVPVPIGRQVLQVTGFDQRGNQTVVDMTIMIAQGAPTPEPNRATGSLPGLLPGQSLATSAGLPENVVIEARPEVQQVAVVSDGWSFTVGLPETSGSVEASEGGAEIVFEQQQTATVSGDGFQPDTRVDIWLFSDPTLLGSVIVAADGSFSGEVYIDPNFAVVGEHTLQLQGVGMDGFIRAANLGVVVEGLEAQTSDTGSTVLWWVVGGAGLLALLIAVVVLSRGRGRRVLS